MANGGVPIQMVLRPKQGRVVLYAHAGVLHVFSSDEWEARGAEGTPLAVLSEAEGGALAWQLRHWLGEQRLKPGYNQRREVDAEYG